MRKLRQNINTTTHKVASYKDAEGNVKGTQSEIKGITVDNSRKLRGRRIDRLFFEEAGSNPELESTYIKGEALVAIEGVKMGTRIVFGTGGDEGPPLATLEKMFNNPIAFGGLCYKHNHTRTGEYIYSGFFVPAHTNVIGYIDEDTNTYVRLVDNRGVVDIDKAKAYLEFERKKKAHDPQALAMHCAEYCMYPEEALNRQGSNNFDQILLAEQHARITIYKEIPKPERGHLVWTYNTGNQITGVKWIADSNGDIEIVEHPMDIDNLYVAGIDSIDVGVVDSVVGEKGSKFCIVVKKRKHGSSGDKYVCKYLKRPKDVRTAYDAALRILWYYKCKANLEESKIGFRLWLREKDPKYLSNFLMKRPNFALGNSKTAKKRNNNLWGTPATTVNIEHGLELIRDLIQDYYYDINFVDIIEQLQKFSYENKGLFDIVMAMVMCEIADEDMFDKRAKEGKPANTWRDIGYYEDENGNVVFGIMPSEQDYGQHYFGIRKEELIYDPY